jgi:uncharacterized protein
MWLSYRRTLSLAALLALPGCGDPPGGNGDPDAGHALNTLRHDVALSIATNVIVPTIAELEAATAALESAVDAYADDPANTTARDAARDAFHAAMEIAQRLEVMQVGPAAPMTASTIGGEGLRSQIYAWPLTNRCAINQQTVDEAYTDVDAFESSPISVRGLGTLEYLLFDEAYTHECTSGAPSPWPPVDEADLVFRRASYARTVSILIHRSATALATAWDPAGEDFLGQVDAAGVGTSVYPGAQEALNAMSDAMFYLDTETKDMKLAVPANLDMMSCAAVYCIQAVESPLTDRSVAHVRENLVAFRAMLIGGAPGSTNLGFDDLLVELDRQALVDSMLTEIDEAIAECDGFPKPLEDALNGTDIASVYELYTEVKHVTDLLKSEFVGVLDLEVPLTAAGDND